VPHAIHQQAGARLGHHHDGRQYGGEPAADQAD
jgi:hypothetical protein